MIDKPIDTSGTAEKIVRGDLNLGGYDIVNLTGNAVSFAGPSGAIAATPILAVADMMRVSRDQAAFAQQMDINMDVAALKSHAVRRLKDKMSGTALRGATTSGAVIGGTAVGGALASAATGAIVGTAAIPIPFLGTGIGLAGGAIGGMLAGGVVGYAMGSPEENTVALTAHLMQVHKAGNKISDEMAFAVLIGNLPDHALETVDKRIKAAIQKGDFEALKPFVNDAEINSKLSAATGVYPPDGNVAKQYAELINGKMLDPKYLLLNDPVMVNKAIGSQTMKQTLQATSPANPLAKPSGMGNSSLSFVEREKKRRLEKTLSAPYNTPG